jgi:hypothetical protein
MFHHDLLLRATLHDDRRHRVERYAAGSPLTASTRRGRRRARRRRPAGPDAS